MCYFCFFQGQRTKIFDSSLEFGEGSFPLNAKKISHVCKKTNSQERGLLKMLCIYIRPVVSKIKEKAKDLKLQLVSSDAGQIHIC